MNDRNRPSNESTPPDVRSSAAQVFDRRDVVWMLWLTLLTVTVLGKDISKGGLRSFDSPVHAMDGVLIHDWVASGPTAWLDPIGFAEAQYAHYPSLSIGRHYPPGFAIVEAAFFGVFGISPVSARMSVVFMGVLAVIGVYVFARALGGRAVSTVAGTSFLVMPAVTLWGQQTMLELPTLAVMIWTAAFVTHYLKKPSHARLALVIAGTLLSLFFKQNAVFLIGAVTACVAVAAWFRQTRWQHVIVLMIFCVAIPVAVWFSMSDNLTKLVGGNGDPVTRWTLSALTHHARHLPEQVGYWLLALGLIGFAVSWRRSRVLGTFLAIWFVACYAMVTVAEFKYVRFFFVGLFPFAIWAALGCGVLLSRVPRRWRAAVVAVLTVVMSRAAFERPIRYFPDHGPSVIQHRDKIEGHAVFFSGLRDADFVFAVRQHIPWRKSVVIRGSKLLYTCLAMPIFDLKPNVSDFADLEAALLPLGLTHLFVERENRIAVHADTVLRDYLAETETFRLIDSVRLSEEPEPNYRNVTMDVYEASRPPQRSVEFLEIPVPRADRTIRVSLGDLPG